MNRAEIKQAIADLGYKYSKRRHYPLGLVWADNGKGTIGRFFLVTHVSTTSVTGTGVFTEIEEQLVAGYKLGRMKRYKTLELAKDENREDEP